MPTLEELEAVRIKPEQTPGTVVAPPSLNELAVAVNPALDTTQDQRSTLNKNLEWQEKFVPGIYKGGTNETVEAHKARVNAGVEAAFGKDLSLPTNRTFTPEETDAAWTQAVDQTVEEGKLSAKAMVTVPKEIVRGAGNVVLDTVQAPGYLAKAFHEADIFGDDGVQFEYGWDKPLTSLLYGVSDLTEKLQKEINPETRDPTLGPIEKIPEAMGSALAFMGLGWASGARTAAGQSLVSGGLGAASGATSQYEDALAYGASPEDALLAYAGGAAFGATEGFPGYFFLKRLNQLGGGKVLEKLNTFGMQGESTLIREAVKGALTEMTQEGIQTVGSNWVASDLAGYDPTRTLGENFWDNVITSGLVGSMMGGGLQMVRDAEIQDARAKLAADFQIRMNSGDAINALSTPGNGFGSFSPVETLVQLNKLKGDLDRHIDQKAEHALAQLEMGDVLIQEDIFGTADVDEMMEAFGLDSPSEINKMQSPINSIDETSWVFDKLTYGKVINAAVEKGLNKVTGVTDGASWSRTPTVKEALQQTPVVTLASGYDEIVQQIKNHLANLNQRILEEDFTGYKGKEGALRMQQLLQLRLQESLEKQQISNTLLRHLKDYTAAFRAAYNPDMKMVIQDYRMQGDSPRTAGWFTGSQKVDLGNGETASVGHLFVDLDTIIQETLNGGEKGNTVDYRSAKRKLFEVLTHELGHSVLSKHFLDIVKKVVRGNPEESREAYKTFILLNNEYRHWIQEMANTSQYDFATNSFALHRSAGLIQGAGKKLIKEDDPTQVQMPMTPDILKTTSMKEDFHKSWPDKYYLLSFDEFFAEMTARLATEGQLSDPAMTKFFQPIMEQYQKLFQTYPEFARSEYGNNWKEFLQARAFSYKMKEEIEKVKANGSRNLWDGLRGKVPGINPDNFAGLRHQLDRWNKGLSLGLNLLQLEQVFGHIPQFASYRGTTEAWAEYQRTFADKATETLENWRSLGKTDAAALSAVLYEESEARANLPPADLAKRLNGEALVVYQQIRAQLNRVLDEMQATALTEANREFSTNAEKLKVSTKEITDEFTKLKESGYFPYVRFGDWTITARARNDGKYLGQDFKAGELITFQAFESRAERDAAYTKLRNELGGGAAVSAGKMREAEYTVQGMPRSILLALRNRLQADGQLTSEVEKAIEQSLEAAAPFKNFRDHFKEKQGIHGFSEDAFRTFAHYIRAAAGNISRVRYAGEMRESIDSMQGDVKTIQEVGGNATARQEMVHWLRRHFDYIMNPANELAALRGVGFVAYLGFNVKSAFVNSTQMFTTVYPYLASRYGDTKSVAEIGRAGAWLKKWVLGKKDFINAPPGSKELRIAELIARGNSEGWLDQSLATELAIAASENSLDRSLYLPSYKRWWHNFSRWSAWPFHMVEKTNRYITAIAAYNLSYAETGSHEKSILAAKLANQQTHFENSRWNRPEFLRGKKSAALLFMNFVQNQLYFAAKDPGAVRYFCVMFLLAGAMGLPGADDLIDVMDAAITKLNKELGMKNPKVQIRVELRKFLDELGANPDLVLHGVSQNSFGLGQVGELTGIPIPRFDLSRSVGMGNIVPGTEIPGMMLSGAKPGDVALEAFSQAAGASGNLVEDYYRSLFSNEPSDWKRGEKLLPLMSLRNMSKAARYAAEGKERTANGVVIADFTPYDIRTGLEIAGQGLGFPIAEVQTGWEKQFAIRDATNFYKTWQMSIQRQLNIAYMQEDREAIVDARAELKEYNESVPMPEMRIKAEEAKAAVREYIKGQMKAGAGFAADRKYHRLSKSLEEVFPDPYADSQGKAGERLP